jgi:phage tail-like protein
MTLAIRHEGAGAYWFEVEVDAPGGDGSTWFIVRQVSGLGQSIEMTEVWVGGASADSYMSLPGKTRWTNIVLQGAVVEKKAFFDWYSKVRIGDIGSVRSDGSIVLKHGADVAIARWNFFGAYPVKYSGPSLDLHSSTVAIETIELTHQGVERVAVG